MKSLRIITVCLMLAALASCQAVKNFIHDDDVIAQVGAHKLYLTDLVAFVPEGLSPEDSTNIADQYIRTWATEQLYLDMATEQLSKSEMDVSKELDAYRNSLLKYRYEQRYVNERLDTTVTRSEVEEYYETHKDLFILDVPILKARFVDIMQDSPNIDVIRKKMASTKYEDIVETDSLAYSSALKYVDYSENWVNAVSLAREFGTDYGTMLSKLSGHYIEIAEDRGDIKIAYVLEIQKAGTLGPLDYCVERIEDIIISNRKHQLLSTLEQDLLDDALTKEKLVVYSGK
ncbi:MAG: hypothetical protein Q4G10_04375 [Bacteroidia bacterium]|nr:hypothetical protein [Bacteroidia bacterium]